LRVPRLTAHGVCRLLSQGLARNLTHTGRGTATLVPVGFGKPSAPISKTTISLPSWFATSIHFPVGSLLKFLGTLMPSVAWSIGVSFVPSHENAAMLLCPRFET